MADDYVKIYGDNDGNHIGHTGGAFLHRIRENNVCDPAGGCGTVDYFSSTKVQKEELRTKETYPVLNTDKGERVMSEVKKRKTHTSSVVKQRYNEKVYDVISVRIPKELAGSFKEKCSQNGDSQAGVIKKAIEDYLNQ